MTSRIESKCSNSPFVQLDVPAGLGITRDGGVLLAEGLLSCLCCMFYV
jgi:hypothetical protein